MRDRKSLPGPVACEHWHFTETGLRARELAIEATRPLGKHQAGNGWLEGGRS